MLLVFSGILALLNDRFLTTANLTNVFRQSSINAIIAAGMTFVILTGGIDLAVGSILAITSALCAAMLMAGYGIIPSVLVALVAGAAAGAMSGVIITKGKVQPFIATLVMMTFLRGATLVFTDGKPMTLGSIKAADAFYMIGNGRVLGIPVPILLTVLVFGIAYYVLTQTRTGRYIYAVGGNEEASRLSGLRTDNVKIFVYTVSGILSAVAGIIVASRLSSAQPTAGTGYELDAIAAVVLGGTSLVGGKGKIMGTIIGVLIIGILNNALNLMEISSYYQMIAKASVILLAVLLDRKNQ